MVFNTFFLKKKKVKFYYSCETWLKQKYAVIWFVLETILIKFIYMTWLIISLEIGTMKNCDDIFFYNCVQ